MRYGAGCRRRGVGTPAVRALPLLAVALAGLWTASPAAAQVSGTVMDAATREGVPYANVALVDSAGNVWAQVVTDSTGYFSVIPMTNDAVFQVQVIAMGYASVPVEPIRYDGSPVHRTIGIVAQPMEMEGLTVEVEGQDLRLLLFGYYDRKARGYGHFIDPEDIAAVKAPGVTGIVRGSPGVVVRGSYEVLFPRNWKPRTGGTMGVAQGLSGQRPTSESWRERFCKPAVFVNGSPEWRHIDPETNSFSPSRSFNDFLPPREDIIGMEVYQSLHSLPREMQIQLERLGGGTNNGAVTSECGALLIWTRLDDLRTPVEALPGAGDTLPAAGDTARSRGMLP